MPDSKKSEDKNSVKKAKKEAKQEAKKKQSAEKTAVFKAQVTVVNRGSVTKGTTFTRKDVEKNSKPKGKGKMVTTAVYREKVAFKKRIVSGDRNKKRLPYECIKLLEQLTSDSRMVFIHYEKAQIGNFLVLGFDEASHVTNLMNAAKESNPSIEVRLAMKIVPDERPRDDTLATSNGYEPYPSNVTSRNGYVERKTSRMPIKAKPDHFSYVYAENDGEDQTESEGSFSCKDRQKRRPISNNINKEHGQYPSLYQENRSFTPSGKPSRLDSLVTNYLYIGPNGEEDSECESKLKKQRKRQSKKETRRTHSASQNFNYSSNLSDNISLSASDSTLDVDDGDFFDYETFNYAKKPLPKLYPHSHNHKSRRRSKSRELPLSEAETRRGGWHSDIMFLTPTKDGGVKVSTDGPVMLYTATRANARYSDDEDNSSDDGGFSDMDESFSKSSGSTLMLEEIDQSGGRDEGVASKMSVEYNRGGRR